MDILELLHGSDIIVEKPDPKRGGIYNDYGQGFYCTQDLDLAKEWSTYRTGGSYVNRYQIDMCGLKVLNLMDDRFSVLHWITVLLEHRRFDVSTPLMSLGRDYLIENYHLDLMKYDVVVGYRADDSYFSFARDFISNALPIEGLEAAIRLGNLGIQYFIRSNKAFDRLTFVDVQEVNRAYYSEKRLERDAKARLDYKGIQEEYMRGGTILRDIINGGK